MAILFKHQEEAVGQLRTGSILCGGVGSGKSVTAVAYFLKTGCKKLYVITTAKKRDSLDWERECESFSVIPTVDSWNNIKRYKDVEDSFFIFDEQRVVGWGSWAKSFLKITKKNQWILLSATPGDTWMDYIAVFVANGFYKNKTEFITRHVVYNAYTKFPKVDRYIEEARLLRLRREILVTMNYDKKTTIEKKNINVSYDQTLFRKAAVNRWNVFENRPIRDITEYCLVLRKIVNSDPSRLAKIHTLLELHRRLIVFYSFNYELEILRQLSHDSEFSYAEYNGHKHQSIPDTGSWVYVVQYTSGSEGWNCVETNAIAFYSLHYSYRIMTQAEGRTDRINTPFSKLYYYYLISMSSIDLAIAKALRDKKNFNERSFSRTS